MKKIFLSIAIISLLLSFKLVINQNSEFQSVESVINDFDLKLQSEISEEAKDGSIVSIITKDDKIIWTKYYGYSDVENKLFADSTTLYRAGSISKSITSFLMMKLMEEGVIKLDEPVEKYFPEVKNIKGYSDSTKITFLQLASHTSGLETEPKLKNASVGPIENWEQKTIESIPTTSFRFKPGQTFMYSNIGYAILGLSLSRAAKKPFIELVHTKIFSPLGMHNSYFKVPEDKKNKIIKGIQLRKYRKPDLKTPENEQQLGRGYRVPNGGVYTTANDLAKFLVANLGYNSILKQESLEIMHSNKVSGSQKFGLGFFLFLDENKYQVEHSGSTSGYTSQLAFDKKSKYGVIILRNFRDADLSVMPKFIIHSTELLENFRNLKK